MVDKKTSEETAAATLDGTELVRGVQSGANVKITTQAIADLGGGGVYRSETITSGASPVAADPDTNLTLVISGGTADVETVNLPLPASPETKVGFKKVICLQTQTDPSDFPVVSTANVVEMSNKTSANLNLTTDPQCGFVFEIAATGVGTFKWVLKEILNLLDPSAWWIFVNTITNRAASDGTVLDINITVAGSSVGNGGGLYLAAGGSSQSGTNGGAVTILPGGGAQDGGDVIIGLNPAGTGRPSLVILGGDNYNGHLPTSDPVVKGALWNSSGTVKISAGP